MYPKQPVYFALCTYHSSDKETHILVYTFSRVHVDLHIKTFHYVMLLFCDLVSDKIRRRPKYAFFNFKLQFINPRVIILVIQTFTLKTLQQSSLYQPIDTNLELHTADQPTITDNLCGHSIQTCLLLSQLKRKLSRNLFVAHSYITLWKNIQFLSEGPSQRDWLPSQRDWLPSQRDWLPSQRDWLPSQRDWLPSLRDWLPSQRDWLPSQRDWLPSQRDWLPSQRDWLPSQRDWLPSQRDWLPSQRDWLPSQRDWLPGQRDWLPSQRDWLPSQRDCLPTQINTFPEQDQQVRTAVRCHHKLVQWHQVYVHALREIMRKFY